MPSPDYAAAVKLLNEADQGRVDGGLPKFTETERAIAITYFCEGVRYGRTKKPKPTKEQDDD
mgnify:CR=1 FL=1